MQLSRGRLRGYAELELLMSIPVCSAGEGTASEALVDNVNSIPAAASPEEDGSQAASTQPAEPAEEEMTVEERKAKRRR